MIAPLTRRDLSGFFERAVDFALEPVVERPYDELADRWRALGLRPGDLVILSLPTGVALLHHFFGVLAAGGVPALVAQGTPSGRLRELVERMRARAVGGMSLPAAKLGADRVERVGKVDVAIFPDAAPPPTHPGEVVLLTSGTSGAASGCVTSVEAIVRNATRHADAIGQRSSDTVLVSLPLHFSFGLVAQAIGTLVRGGRLIIAGPPFVTERYTRAIESHGVDVNALSPTQVRTLLANDVKIPRRLRTLSVGGDALAPEHVADLLRARPDRELYMTYGLTQAGPRVSTLAAHAEPAARHASVGLPLEGTSVELEALGDGSGRTQLIVRSDTVMRRQIGLVEGRNADELRAPGVLATGDVFDTDQDGYLFYRRRLSEYILRGGEKVCLATVRRLATRIAGVVTARTRVEPSAEGEDYHLMLVVAEGSSIGVDHCRKELAKSIRLAELPRTIEILEPHDPRLGHK